MLMLMLWILLMLILCYVMRCGEYESRQPNAYTHSQTHKQTHSAQVWVHHIIFSRMLVTTFHPSLSSLIVSFSPRYPSFLFNFFSTGYAITISFC
jgi:hypothetical protein